MGSSHAPCRWRWLCITGPLLVAHAQEPISERQRNLERHACLKRLRLTDFATEDFHSEWMNQENMTEYSDCLYKLRTTHRPAEKVVHVGGVHYPTLLTANHQTPPVSTAGSQWCWLSERGDGGNGLSSKLCCDSKHGPRGLESCWSEHFTYDLCCLGDVDRGEIPHFFVGPAFDINVANAVRQIGTFDLGQSYALQTLCKPGDTVLDIGANIGGFTVPLAERVGPTGAVHSFEPFRKVYQHLNANIALNGLSNVFAHNVALGQEEKELDVFTADLSTFNFPSAMKVEEQYSKAEAEKNNIRYDRKKEKIIVRRLDSFDFGEDVVKLVKIDVEFMELGVVLGGKEFFRKHQPVLWAENEPYFDDPSDRTFVDTMAQELGYACQPVARLELLCMPAGEGQDGLPAGFQRVFRHLQGRFRDMSLWRALSEVEA